MAAEIALVMMIKNEQRNIEKSFKSVLGLCASFVVLDTGSTDQTIPIVKSFCDKHKVALHLKCSTFVNFEVSRNELLNYADEVFATTPHFLLLLDCNDELNPTSIPEIREVIAKKTNVLGFDLCQEWKMPDSLDTYFNTRLVLSGSGWRFKGAVHEVLLNDKVSVRVQCPSIVLFQDRTHDDDKTVKRFKRDKQLLYADHLKNPKDTRTLFYLAQTCSCLQQFKEAYEYYLLRSTLSKDEEVFHCYLRLGDTTYNLGHPWEESQAWYMKAFILGNRAEPLVRLAEHYQTTKEWNAAYMFAVQACDLKAPEKCMLFVNKKSYEYTRWHILANVALQLNKMKEGARAAREVVKSSYATEEDKKLVGFYVSV